MQTLEQLKNGELAGSRRLKLSEGLTHFPEAIYSLAETLEVLDLSDNQLSDLPDDLHRFSQLRILFASNNRFQHIPDGIGLCPQLSMLGFKHNQIQQVSEQCLPSSLRWLILTDNHIESLPHNFGCLTRMEKLMLAGNKLKRLPDSMLSMEQLGLLRISANELEAFPDFVLQLPRLAWLAFAGNPFCDERGTHDHFPTIESSTLEMHELLGRGASGLISRASWTCEQTALRVDAEESVAVKVFRGDVTSDGYPQDELDACLSISEHPNLVSPIARIQEPGRDAMVMKLIPDHYDNLGQPPSLDSCTRDTFLPEQSLTHDEVDQLVAQMTSVVEHLEAHEVCHGDLYAHNTLINGEGHILFGDFGAASRYDYLNDVQKAGLQQIERRALAYFEEDLRGLVPQAD